MSVLRVYLNAILVAYGAFTVGYVIAYPSPFNWLTGPSEYDCNATFPDAATKVESLTDPDVCLAYGGVPTLKKVHEEWDWTTTERDLFKSMPILASIAGPFLVRLLFKFFGRRLSTSIVSALGGVGWLFLLGLLKRNYAISMVGRIITGVVNGALSQLVPVYISEITPLEHKGKCGILNKLFNIAGVLTAYFAAYGCSPVGLAMIDCAVSFVHAITIWLVPESPASFVQQTASKSETIFQRKYIKPLIISIFFMFFQQFSGINAILTSLNELFVKADVSIDATLASGAATSAQIVSSFSAGFIVDYIGRKYSWILSSSGCCVFLLLYGITDNPFYVDMGKATPIVFIFFYELFYSFALGPVAWLMMPEYFPSTVRASGSTIVTVSNLIFSFILVMSFSSVKDAIGIGASLLIFAGIMAFSIAFGFFFVFDPVKDDVPPVLDNKVMDNMSSQENEESNNDQV